MWWLLGQDKERNAGDIIHKHCPHCDEDTPVLEIVEASSYTVWFVPVSSGKTVVGYVCQQCGEQFTDTGSGGDFAGGCCGCVVLIVIAALAGILLVAICQS